MNLLNRREFVRRLVVAVPVLAVMARKAVGGEVFDEESVGEPDLGFMESSLTVIRRSQWAPVEPSIAWMKRAYDYNKITIHHAGSVTSFNVDEDVVMKEIQNLRQGHLQKRYGDIGYHFIIDYAGRIWEGRPVSYEGVHVSRKNAGNIGVMLLGNFEVQYPSREQLLALKQVCFLLGYRYEIPHTRMYGHRDLGQSACPGRNLYSYALRLRTAVV